MPTKSRRAQHPQLTPAQKAAILGDPVAVDLLRLRASNTLIDFIMGSHSDALSSAQRIALMDIADCIFRGRDFTITRL